VVCTGSRRSIFSDDHRSAGEPSAAKIAHSCSAFGEPRAPHGAAKRWPRSPRWIPAWPGDGGWPPWCVVRAGPSRGLDGGGLPRVVPGRGAHPGGAPGGATTRSRRHAGAAQPGVDGTARTDLRASRRVPRRRRLGGSRACGERRQPRSERPARHRPVGGSVPRGATAGAAAAARPDRQLRGDRVAADGGRPSDARGRPRSARAGPEPRAEPAGRHRRPTGGSEPARRDDRSGHWRLGARAWR